MKATFANDVKITGIKLYDEIGKLFDKQLKQRISDHNKSGARKEKETVESHLLMDDHQIGTINKNMQFKIGAFLTNLMCKTLKYKIGNQSFLLLQPQLTRVGKPTASDKNIRKYISYVTFNKAFVEQFV